MGIISWFKKRHKEKNKDKTIPKKPYWVGWHKITEHAVKRMNEREITKGDVHENLTTKPIHKSKWRLDKQGRPSYERYSKNKIITRINPLNQKVTTVTKMHTRIFNKYNKKGK